MLDYPIQGSKGGEKKAHTPVETPNNLLSVAYAKVLIAVAEGELAGVPTDQDIFLDGTPLANPDGSKNFGGVKWEWRPGTTDQTYIAGLPEVSTEYNVGVELKSGTPYVRSLTKTELDGVRITFQWPALLEQQSNGDTVGVSMDYKIEIATDGGPFVLYQQYNINGKTNTSYERTHRVNLPKANSGWIVRAVKITPDTTSGTIQDTMNVKSIAEVVDVKQRYPNTALLYVEFDSRMFGTGSIPKVSVKTKGRIIRVPNNYDPATRTYSGIWSGAFKWAWSDNPAWVFHDIITQDRFGLGNKVNLNMVDKWALYEIAQYCDVMVDDGHNVGVMQPRHTMNVYIQEKADAWQVLRDIATAFNGMTYWNGNQFTAVADKQESFVNAPIFSRSNVINGRFDYAAADDKSIYTSALVSYDEPDNHYNTEVESTFETEQILRWGGDRQIELSAIGCTSRGEAQRRGKYTLITNMYNRTVSFRTGLQGLNDEVMPGKLIHVVDPLIGGRPFTGRIKIAVGTVLTLDRTIDASPGDIMYITKSNGTTEGRTISAVAGNIVTLQLAYTELPLPNAVWYLEAADLKSQLFRVTKITSPEESVYEIEGVEYNDSKYAAIDNGARLEPRPISVVPPNIQQAPTNVHVTSYNYVEQTMSVSTMVIAWDQTPNATGYEVQWKVGNGDWVNAGSTGALEINVKGIYSGQYQARVRAINPFGIKSVWSSSALTTLNGKVGSPPALTSLTVTPIVFGMQLNWTFAAGSEDTARTEIMYSPTTSFAQATKLGDFAYPQKTHEINGLKAGAVFYFWARIVDRSGNVSPYFPLTTANGVMGASSTDLTKYEEYFLGQINESALGQELATKIDKIDVIEVDLSNLEVEVEKVNVNVNWIESQLGAVQDQLKNDIEDVDNTLTSAIDLTNKDLGEIKQDVIDLNATVDDLQEYVDGIVDALEYDPNKAYSAGDSVRGIDSNRLYQAKQNVPAETPPPNDTYWQDVGQVISGYGAVVSQLNTNTTTIKQQGDTLTAQGQSLTALGTRVTTAEGNIASNTNAISSLTTTVTTQGNTITSQGQSITALQTDVTNLQTGQSGNASAITALTTRVTTAEGTITSQGQSITSLNATVGTLQTDLNGVKSTVTSQGTAITGLTTTVTNQGTTISSHSTSITALQNSVSTLQTDVSGLTTTVNGNSGAITNLQNTVTSQGNTITAQGQNITTLNADVSTAKTDISGLKTTTTTQGTAITNLQTTVTQHGNDITANSNNITALSATVHFNELDALYAGDETDAQIADALKISKANATATESLTATVTSLDGVVTAQGQSITDLSAELENIDGSIGGHGTAISNLQTTVTQQGNTLTSQGVSMTQLNNSLTVTNTNVGAAQSAADAANTLAGGKGKVFFQASAPGAADQLSQNLWIDTTSNNNTPKRWNGSAWVAVTDKVATDAAAAAAAANTLALTKADASAVTALTTRVTTAEGAITSQGNSITTLNNSLTTTNTNVTAAQAAADAANTLAGGKGKVFYGTTAPAVAEQLSQNLWIDTNGGANTPKRWNGSAWVAVTDKVATDAAAAAANALSVANTKADAAALTSLTTRVTNAEGSITSQGNSITSLNSSLATTNTNVTAAQNAANAANTLAGGKGEVIYGSTTPTVAERLDQNLWIDTTGNANTPKRWNGSAWVVVTDKVATDAAAAAASALAQVATKAESSAVTALSNIVTQHGNDITANSNDITLLNTDVHFKELDALYAGEETDSQVADALKIANGAASANESLTAEVTQQGNLLTAQATQITDLSSSLSDVNGAVVGQGTAIENLKTVTTSQGNNITSQGISITQLTNSVAGKADATAVTSLTTRVTTAEGNITSNASAITNIQATLGGLGLDPAPNALWQFDTTVEGWTAIGATLSWTTGGVATITSTGTDPQFVSPTVAINGNAYTEVKVKITRVAGSGWDGQVFYSTAGHGFSASYVKAVPNPNLGIGQSIVLDLDMKTLTVGGTDWTTNTITKLRFDFGNTSSDVFSVDWVGVGRDGPSASSQAVSTLTATVTQQGTDITAQATKLDGIFLQVNPAQAGDTTGYAGSDQQYVGVWSEQSARIEDGVATGQRIDVVQASVNSNSASIINEAAVRATADSALATQQSTTQASVDGLVVSTQQTSSALATLDGKSQAMWAVKLQVNAQGQYVTAGVGLGLENTPGGLQSTFLVNADTFAVVNGVNTTVTNPFTVTGGQVFIKDAIIGNGSITSAKISSVIQSDNYVANTSGWRLTKAGVFEINGTVAGQGKVLITNQAVNVYDVNGVLRVRMGIW